MEGELLTKHGIVFARKPAALGLCGTQIFPGRILVCNRGVPPHQGFTGVAEPQKVCHPSSLPHVVRLWEELKGEAQVEKRAAGHVFHWEVTAEDVRSLGLGVEVQVVDVSAGANCERQAKLRLTIEHPTFRECQNLQKLVDAFRPDLGRNVEVAEQLPLKKMKKKKKRQVLRFYFIKKVLYATKVVLSWESSSGIEVGLAAGAQGVEVGGDVQYSSARSEKSISLSLSQEPLPWGMQLRCLEYYVEKEKAKVELHSCCFNYAGEPLKAWPNGKADGKEVHWPEAAVSSKPGNAKNGGFVSLLSKKLSDLHSQLSSVLSSDRKSSSASESEFLKGI